MHRFQVSIPYFTGLPTDVVQNNFHMLFTVGSPVGTDFAAMRSVLDDFYGDIFTNISTNSMAPWMRPGSTNVKAYNLADPIPRAPVYNNTSSFGVVQAGSSNMPLEAALCLSYQGTKVSGLPQARRRGRLYIGGLGIASTTTTTSAFPEPTPQMITAMCTAGTNLITNALSNGWEWNVWSETLGTGTAVTDGWVDNAFDTQRRRGPAPSARTTWT